MGLERVNINPVTHEDGKKKKEREKGISISESE